MMFRLPALSKHGPPPWGGGAAETQRMLACWATSSPETLDPAERTRGVERNYGLLDQARGEHRAGVISRRCGALAGLLETGGQAGNIRFCDFAIVFSPAPSSASFTRFR